MTEVVLDASAVLAFIFEEEGADRVAPHLPGAMISAVNLAEVATKLLDFDMPADTVEATIAALELVVLPFDRGLAFETAHLRPLTQRLGLSLGDRACLATAKRHGASALTADRAWSRLGEAAAIAIELVR